METGEWVKGGDNTQYFIDNFCRNGELVPLEPVLKRKSKIRCYSKKYDCDVLVNVDSIMEGRWFGFESIIDKTQYFIDTFCRGDELVPLEPVLKRNSKIRCYSKELDCEVLINVSNIMSGLWVSFKSIIEKTQYFIDNFCRGGELIPLEPVLKRVSKIRCYSKDYDCEVLINVDCIMSGRWIHQGWFHQWAKQNPKLKAYFYVVKLKYEDETFYKAGVTRNENKSRFNYYKPYKVVEVLEWVGDDAITISKMEQKYLKKNKSNYIPKHEFDGMTEIINYK